MDEEAGCRVIQWLLHQDSHFVWVDAATDKPVVEENSHSNTAQSVIRTKRRPDYDKFITQN